MSDVTNASTGIIKLYARGCYEQPILKTIIKVKTTKNHGRSVIRVCIFYLF